MRGPDARLKELLPPRDTQIATQGGRPVQAGREPLSIG